MTALAAPRISARPGSAQRVHYEVLCPDTGEVLAYVTLTPEDSRSPLAEALLRNGLRLVPLYPSLAQSAAG